MKETNLSFLFSFSFSFYFFWSLRSLHFLRTIILPYGQLIHTVLISDTYIYTALPLKLLKKLWEPPLALWSCAARVSLSRQSSRDHGPWAHTFFLPSFLRWKFWFLGARGKSLIISPHKSSIRVVVVWKMDHHSALIRLPLAGQQLVGLDHQCSLKKQQKPLVVVSADGAAGPSQQPFDAVNFPIDDLLDFSNEDIAGPIGEEAAADHQLQLAAASSFTAVVPSVAKVETISCLQAAALASSSSSCSSSVEKGSTELEHLHIDSELPQLEEEGTAAAASIEEADLCVPVSHDQLLHHLHTFHDIVGL